MHVKRNTIIGNTAPVYGKIKDASFLGVQTKSGEIREIETTCGKKFYVLGAGNIAGAGRGWKYPSLKALIAEARSAGLTPVL